MTSVLFDSGWFYSEQSVDMSYDEFAASSADMKRIDIPHDMLISDADNLYKNCTGFYVKEFILDGDAAEKTVYLRFDGVYPVCEIYLNGSLVRTHKYGYSAFDCDLTGLVREGRNTVTVRVEHRAPNSRWYSGAGIFRDVTLKIAEPVHILPDGVYIHTSLNPDGSFDAAVKTETSAENVTLFHTILDMDGEEIGCCEYIPDGDGYAHITVVMPCLWDITNPYLYTLRTEVICDDIVTDTAETRFGFRMIRFDPDNGFFLNGRHIKLNGVCLHHDLGSLGAAFNSDALRRQLLLMKEMGANAVRTSHNMPAEQFMDIADEVGMLVDSEAYDMWGRPKTEFDNARFFDETCEEDVKSWVCRDRNHPSLIMWSIGNEIYDTHDGEYGRVEMRRLIKNVSLHDPLKNGYVTFGSNYIPWENTQKCAEELDAVGGNYAEHLYNELHEKHPKWNIYGSETAARGQSRGIYHFPLEHTVRTYEDMQMSSLENSRSGKGDRTPQTSIIADRDCKFSAGQFIWTGFDYIGEPTPYSTKNAYYGQCDTAGFKKDSYYLYQAAWTNKTVLHLMPYWDFNDGQLIDVCAYTNAPEAELFLNGKSLGRQKIDNAATYWAKWQLPYEYGEIKVTAYDNDGNSIAEDSRHSFGDSRKIVLSADRTSIPADGKSLIFVDISTVDDNGCPVENSRSRMNVSVTGAGRLIGLDNGDSTDYESYKAVSRKLFSGHLAAVIASKQEAGEIHLTVSSNGLETASAVFNALPCDTDSGVSCISENSAEFNRCDENEIPVRKIALRCDSSRELNAECRTAVVHAEIFPENASLCDIEFKAVTDSGIISNLASVKVLPDGRSAEITALGDGHFRFRASAANGKRCSDILSDLEFTVSGIGSAVIDPYNFVSATFCSRTNQPLDEVLKGGVRCVKNGVTYICFDNLDFGSDLSDEVTVPILRWFRDDEMPVEIWEGMPDEGGAELLYSGIYKRDFVWQTYQPLVCPLKRRLSGIRNITVVTRSGDEEVNIQGIQFRRVPRAYATLTCADAVRVYGDSFTENGEYITGIGNNVTVEFGHMDFTDGFSKLAIRGRTDNPVDSVHIILNGKTEKRLMAEFVRTEDYSEQIFELEGISGECDVRLMFLPGCSFDLNYIRFEK